MIHRGPVAEVQPGYRFQAQLYVACQIVQGGFVALVIDDKIGVIGPVAEVAAGVRKFIILPVLQTGQGHVLRDIQDIVVDVARVGGIGILICVGQGEIGGKIPVGSSNRRPGIHPGSRNPLA